LSSAFYHILLTKDIDKVAKARRLF